MTDPGPVRYETDDDSAWAELRSRLAAELATLPDGEFVVLDEAAPAPAPERPLGLLRRTPKPAPTRYVQVLRTGDYLLGECVGSTLFGGDWEATPAQHDQLRSLGWLAPGDPDPAGTQPSYPNYWCTVFRDRAAELAAMATGALRLLGADPVTLAWRRDS